MQYADPSKLRAYFFGNMYLSPIQQGIQCSHVVTHMFATKYPNSHHGSEHNTLHEWGNSGVTKILLNGGYQSNLKDIHEIFTRVAPSLGLPFGRFFEEEAALNGALTSVGIVVPEEIYAYQWESVETIFSVFREQFEPIPENYPPSAVYTSTAYQLKNATESPQGILELISRTTELSHDEAMMLLHRTLKTARLA